MCALLTLAEGARLVILWGANLARQPTTAPHLVEARRRGARVVAIDVGRGEASRHADETWLIRPGTDAALALAMAHVIVAEGLAARDFLSRRTGRGAEQGARARIRDEHTGHDRRAIIWPT